MIRRRKDIRLVAEPGVQPANIVDDVGSNLDSRTAISDQSHSFVFDRSVFFPVRGVDDLAFEFIQTRHRRQTGIARQCL